MKIIFICGSKVGNLDQKHYISNYVYIESPDLTVEIEKPVCEYRLCSSLCLSEDLQDQKRSSLCCRYLLLHWPGRAQSCTHALLPQRQTRGPEELQLIIICIIVAFNVHNKYLLKLLFSRKKHVKNCSV